MPAPLSNLMSAIDAPVVSLRHSIFSCTPLSDFSRQATFADWIRISSRLGAPSGSLVMVASYRVGVMGGGKPGDVADARLACCRSRAPGHRFHFDQPREIRHRRFVGEPVDGAHFIDEDERARGLLRRDLLAEDGLDLVLAAAERDDEIRVIVDVKINRLA